MSELVDSDTCPRPTTQELDELARQSEQRMAAMRLAHDEAEHEDSLLADAGEIPTRLPPYDRAALLDGVLTGGARFVRPPAGRAA